ncbi:MAG: N-6 DNA methylase [Deltaproteobacteria bacterium]|nr:N-6 DNA methylase [Deltaproteobacteria bacterium]
MSRKSRDPVAEAFSETAGRLAERWPRLGPDSLARASRLAMLRRTALGAMDDAGSEASLERRFDEALELGCPLLDSSLDGRGGPPARAAIELAAATPGQRDPGLLYPALLDLGLRRAGRGGGFKVSIGRSARRRGGTYFTPAWMAKRLVEIACDGLRPGDPRVLDPACGAGHLLASVVERFVRGLPAPHRAAEIRRRIAERIRGVDIDPLAAALTRTRLWQLADPEGGPVEGLAQAIVCGDAIAGPLDGKSRSRSDVRWPAFFPDACGAEGAGFDLVVANPPFEVLTGFGRRAGLKSYVERIRRSGYALALGGMLNTYRLFLERSLQLLAPGGRLAIVLPYGFLMDRSASELRAHMLARGYIARVEAYPESAHAFESAGQSVVLLWAIKRDGACRSVRIARGDREGGEEERIPVEQIQSLDACSLPLPVAPAAAVALAARMHALNELRVEERFTGRVGEVDQTKYRAQIRSKPAGGLLVRGAHLRPFGVELGEADPHERWLDRKAFEGVRGGGSWREDISEARIVQTGIVNMEARRRFVAAEVPAGVFLGNSVNYWVPTDAGGWQAGVLRGYLLGLLNSAPLEWRFRLTSSNNNVNLYEVCALPLPRLQGRYPKDRYRAFVDRCASSIASSRLSPLGMVRQITAGWGAPCRDDRVVAELIASLARQLERERDAGRFAWLQHVLDHLVNWHLGLDEPDLELMLEAMPARAWRES